MRRGDLQKMADAKLVDAEILFDAHRWSSAYYLSGYAVEFGLKACVARQISADTIPDKAILKDVLSHEFTKLIGLAGLRTDLKQEQDGNADFAANWAILSEWSPDARYKNSSQMEAAFILSAIQDKKNGVLQWIKRYW